MKNTEPQEKLLAALRRVPDQLVGPHLTSDESVSYALGELPEYKVSWLDRHLESCAECAARVQRVQNSMAQWQTEAGARALADLQGRLREALEGLLTQRPIPDLVPPPAQLDPPLILGSLIEVLSSYLAPAFAGGERKPLACNLDGWPADTMAVEGSDGSRRISISSNALELNGRCLVIREDGRELGRARFRLFGKDHVMAQFVITKEQRETLPKTLKLDYKLD